MSSKKEEALAHVKEAEKYLKTSFLKWKPDFDSAADEYNKAATCYKTIRAHSECRDMLAKAANCYQQNNSLFAAAKCYEQGVLMSKELNDLATVISLCQRSASLYQQHGSPESAAGVLEKGAKIVETARPADAVPLYQKATDVVMLEDRQRTATTFISKASRLLIRLGRYQEAITSVVKEMGYQQELEDAAQMNRLVVVLVLLQLAVDDVVAARKAFDEWGSWCQAEEIATLTMLLEGYEEEDADLAKRALNSSFIKHMDIDYAKLARCLKMPESMTNPQPVSPSKPAGVPAAPETVSPSATGALADEFQHKAGVTEASPPTSPAADGAPTTDAADDGADDDDEYGGGLC